VQFLLVFLPVVFAGYFLLLKFGIHLGAKLWLLGASLYFYGYWEISYLPLLIGSILFNFLTSQILFSGSVSKRLKLFVLSSAICANVAYLGYFKYADFLIENINLAFNSNFSLMNLLLPLAISFFTFQQIAYLVDAYRGEVKERNLLDYAIFVSFFPQLIAGPIVHHKQMMPQFANISNSRINLNNISIGLLLLGIGLFKKSVIADKFAPWVANGYVNTEGLSMIGSWALSLGFTMQLVFDFTAYSDMAIGIGLLFNIRLPVNFYSSLKSTSIGEFWARWHLTLTDFLRQYIYIPLGGNRKGFTRSNINLFIVFMVAGIWHGSGWNFIMWGVLQGAANVMYRIWRSKGLSMPSWLGWLLTFNFINVICVYFRAPTFADSTNVLKGMIGLNGIAPQNSGVGTGFAERIQMLLSEIGADWQYLVWITLTFVLALGTRNAMEIASTAKINTRTAAYTGLLLGISLLTILGPNDEFIYFNF